MVHGELLVMGGWTGVHIGIFQNSIKYSNNEIKLLRVQAMN
jgi:hypothetical protein